jgi:DNA mismatch repair protein MutS
MKFIADEQTLADLNLLGKYKHNSIFSLFNQVQTTGGEKLLQEMFENPLQDHLEINQRSSVFKYFQGQSFSFPVEQEVFSQMETYLESDSGSSLTAVSMTLLKYKFQAAIWNDGSYRAVHNGQQQTMAALKNLRDFISVLQDGKHPYRDQALAMKNILSEERLGMFLNEKVVQQHTLLQTIKYDHLLRTVLKTELHTLLRLVYELDVCIAVGCVGERRGFNYAKALPNSENRISVAALSHPNISKAVSNAINITNEKNLVFLTGANMAGKSTLMKAFGINIYLAHMGFPVSASKMEFSVKDGIYSSINVPDDLNQGYSHFYAEVLRVKKVAAAVSSGKDLVVIFDELFKGTNVKDAYEATLAVTAAFSAYRNCAYIISTHIIEAGEVLIRQCDNILSLYLPTIMNGNVPTYTYQLRAGISADRHGMMIIENEGIIDLLENTPPE